MDLSVDSLPVPQIGKNFFLGTFGFSPAQGTICRQRRLPTRFSMPSEDISSVVSIVFMRVLQLFLHPDGAVANLKCPILSRNLKHVKKHSYTMQASAKVVRSLPLATGSALRKLL